MNRYILIHRLRGPAILLLISVLALMDHLELIHHFWSWFWPLLMITIGALMLAERAAFASDDSFSQPPYPGAPYPGYPGAMAGTEASYECDASQCAASALRPEDAVARLSRAAEGRVARAA